MNVEELAARSAFTSEEMAFILASPVAQQIGELFVAMPGSSTVGDFRAAVREILDGAGLSLSSVRVGQFMQTFSGIRFYPLDPRPTEIKIVDIAHALSMQCRYAGHCLRYYSTAEHSVHLTYFVKPENRLAAILHDGGETYLPDMVRPTKRSFPAYTAAEEVIRRMIFVMHGLDPEMSADVVEVDDRICADEKAQNMSPCEWNHNPEPLGVKLQFWSPEEAEARFIARYAELGGKLL